MPQAAAPAAGTLGATAGAGTLGGAPAAAGIAGAGGGAAGGAAGGAGFLAALLQLLGIGGGGGATGLPSPGTIGGGGLGILSPKKGQTVTTPTGALQDTEFVPLPLTGTVPGSQSFPPSGTIFSGGNPFPVDDQAQILQNLLLLAQGPIGQLLGKGLSSLGSGMGPRTGGSP